MPNAITTPSSLQKFKTRMQEYFAERLSFSHLFDLLNFSNMLQDINSYNNFVV